MNAILNNSFDCKLHYNWLDKPVLFWINTNIITMDSTIHPLSNWDLIYDTFSQLSCIPLINQHFFKLKNESMQNDVLF